eukprot:CAMPEP_0197834894 /NCGR_PEP_ID=MMETSP1437-20131217/24066_1 /TAXON_ID=49252 ORGANISM="Eucampia antarctica, Strain CCMP1452" /NCGR_SAMPLE_ID=MMETSP1437 /ASSEMBLY_ACC=CAM_ASM_001096 /LENGTH=186 /DNA_ID=CAMNT_0043439933 /DNA_START=59 /DNA_END=619 /DNA_ORIENTATION=-
MASRTTFSYRFTLALLACVAIFNTQPLKVSAFAPLKTTLSRTSLDFGLPGATASFMKSNTILQMSSSGNDDGSQKSELPMLLDPGTKGGALFLSLVLFVLPIGGYEVVTLGFGVDGIEAGKWIGVGFTLITCLLWFSTYLFRVATKDMTYAKQLKDYEDAVIAKRLEELDEDEIQALVEDIERDDF